MLVGRRYRLSEEIGSGGMADVYKAVDETLGRPVAVKLMHARLASDPSFAARFQQEAKAAANLQSPYIVNIYDWGQETLENGQPLYYIVMEYVRGEDLKSIIRRQGALPSRKVAEIGAMVCSALSVAHGYDIIHRDIKPHNIMVLPDGNIKVMDFGIARAGNTQMTQTGSVLGSAHYVSPEQAQGRDLTAASDLYSLGVVMYEASTGQMPFDGDSPVATALKQVQEQAVRPTAINPEVDPNLEQVIGYAMAKDPRARYATADAMRRDLLRVARGEPIIGAHGDADSDATSVMGAAAAGAAGGAAGAALAGRRDPQDMDGTTVMPAVGDGTSPATPMTPGVERTIGPEEKKKGTKAWIWVAVITCLVAAAGLLAWQLGVFDADEEDAAVDMPDVTRITLEAAKEVLREEGIAVIVPPEDEDADSASGLLETILPDANPELIIIEEAFSPDVPEGYVIDQYPEAGAELANPADTRVTLTVSKGEEEFEVPDLTGMTLDEARQVVADADFDIRSTTEHHATVPADQIISQSPEAGTELAGGSVINVVVSQGVESVDVPNVRTMTRAQANTTLTNAGFQVSVREVFSNDVNEGIVIDQNPRQGASLQRGSTVEITVSRGPETVAVPNVLNQTEDAARTTLTNAGFVVRVSHAAGDQGIVIGQSPNAGQRAQPGSTVTITVGNTPAGGE